MNNAGSGTVIRPCVCQHKAQDELHGKGMRVMNYARNANNKQGGYRCTVCERTVGS